MFTFITFVFFSLRIFVSFTKLFFHFSRSNDMFNNTSPVYKKKSSKKKTFQHICSLMKSKTFEAKKLHDLIHLDFGIFKIEKLYNLIEIVRLQCWSLPLNLIDLLTKKTTLLKCNLYFVFFFCWFICCYIYKIRKKWIIICDISKRFILIQRYKGGKRFEWIR